MQLKKSQIDQYQIIQTLGEGAYAKVKLVQDENQNLYAAKIFSNNDPSSKQKYIEAIENEVKKMFLINHPNVIKVKSTNTQGIYTKKSGKTQQIAYILMELAPGGEMIEFLIQTGRFPEPIVRTFFLQILEGVNAIHSSGISHRDLKPENILFDQNYQIKIADFGFATYLCGRDGSGLLSTRCGTSNYMAPEVIQSKQYRGEPADIFSLGVILFIMLTKNPPFNKADINNDIWYFRLQNQQNDF